MTHTSPKNRFANGFEVVETNSVLTLNFSRNETIARQVTKSSLTGVTTSRAKERSTKKMLQKKN